MNLPTLRRTSPLALALALFIAFAQPVIVTPPAYAAAAPIVTDGGTIKALKAIWDKFGPTIMYIVYDFLDDWLSPDPPQPAPSAPPAQDP